MIALYSYAEMTLVLGALWWVIGLLREWLGPMVVHGLCSLPLLRGWMKHRYVWDEYTFEYEALCNIIRHRIEESPALGRYVPRFLRFDGAAFVAEETDFTIPLWHGTRWWDLRMSVLAHRVHRSGGQNNNRQFILLTSLRAEEVLRLWDSLSARAKFQPTLRVRTNTFIQIMKAPVRMVYPEAVSAAITHHLDRFFANPNATHFGILLHGPPGTGKSSYAPWIAQKYQCNITIHTDGIPASRRKNDQPSVYVIDEIDKCLEKSKDVRSLLRYLENEYAERKIVFLLTTNVCPEDLPNNLVRPGRVDLTQAVGLMSAEDMARLVGLYGLPAADAERVVAALAARAPLPPCLVKGLLELYAAPGAAPDVTTLLARLAADGDKYTKQ